MKFPCLVLDHDDTVVNSTATVHFPCFAEYTAKFFPKAKRYMLEEYILKNFSPGVYEFFHGEVGMTEDDMKHEQAYWHEYVQHHVPQAYAGMRELLWDYVNAGGTICVVSHSLSPNILRDYRENGLPEPEISSVAVSGIVMTRQPSSCLNSFKTRLTSVVLPAAGPPVRTTFVMCLAISHASFPLKR